MLYFLRGRARNSTDFHQPAFYELRPEKNVVIPVFSPCEYLTRTLFSNRKFYADLKFITLWLAENG